MCRILIFQCEKMICFHLYSPKRIGVVATQHEKVFKIFANSEPSPLFHKLWANESLPNHQILLQVIYAQCVKMPSNVPLINTFA